MQFTAETQRRRDAGVYSSASPRLCGEKKYTIRA